MAPRSNTLRDHDGRRRPVKCDAQTRVQTTATSAFLRPLTTGDVQFSQWTLADKRRLFWRPRRDSHRAHQVATRASDHLDRRNCDVCVDRVFKDLSRRASHDGRNRGIRSGIDLDPGGEVCGIGTGAPKKKKKTGRGSTRMKADSGLSASRLPDHRRQRSSPGSSRRAFAPRVR